MNEAEWNKLPPKLKSSLALTGIGPQNVVGKPSAREPYTQVGAASLKGEGMAPDMVDDLGGVTVKEGLNADGSVPTSTTSFVLYNPKYGQGEEGSMIRAHEMEHVLANQGGGQKTGVNERWDMLRGTDGAGKAAIVSRLAVALPYLQKEWGLPPGMLSAYFENPRSGLALNELFATLSALEQQRNKKLTDDPYIRDNVFKTPGERETYNAITGLRQTRLDAKDLPPYTRQPETPTRGVMDKINSMLDLLRQK